MFLFLIPVVSAAFTWSSCGSESDLAIVKKIELTPSPLRDGDMPMAHVQVTYKEDVEKYGMVMLSMNYGDIVQNIPLCALIVNTGWDKACPLKKGDVDMTNMVVNRATAGHYDIRLILTAGDRQILCIDTSADVLPPQDIVP